MADTNQTGEPRGYPLPAYNYRVTITGDGVPQVMGFSEVSGLNVESEPIVYSHGMSFLVGRQLIRGRPKPIRITLKRGIFHGRSPALITWFTRVLYGNLPGDGSARRTVHIDLCDETGKAVLRWTARDALPIRLEGPVLDANSSETAVELLELIADELKISHHP